jgi:hypothetical protein
MMPRRRASVRIASWVPSLGMLALVVALPGQAQMDGNERAFPQSKATIEKALTAMQSSMAGHLPVLDGFAKPAEHPLDRYQRGYYQATVQVSSVPSGGSVVRVSTKVTAWYADPVASRSGYQLLASNGRLEADLLDQLAEQLAKSPTEPGTRTASSAPPKPPSNSTAEEPAISAPSPKFPASDRTFSSSLSQGLAAHELTNGRNLDAVNAEKADSTLQAEANSLEEILKNTAHPKNLVAVKKSGTPVVANPSLTAKPQFLASMHDEFEMLDFNADWVHVRISGLSRGWIWRNSLEMPEGIPDTATHAGPGPQPAAAELFHVTREETSPFPGDWEPLRGKSVKIISVEKLDEKASGGGPQEKLEFAKYLLEKSSAELAQKPQDLAGVVLIFDSADGGMIATTLPALQRWKAGIVSDAALWHQCFFDPPEIFGAQTSANQ